MSIKHFGIIVATASMISTSALADSVDVDYVHTGLGRSVSLHLDGGTKNVFAGQLYHQMSDGTGAASGLNGEYITFCTEIVQTVSMNATEFELVALENAPNTGPMGATKAQAIRDIFAYANGSQYTSNSDGDNKNFVAAFQIAIWEIVYDYDGTLGSLDVEKGDLTVTDIHRSNLSDGIVDHLIDLFGNVGVGSDMPGLFAVTSASFQDQLVMIPLPAPLAMGALGLAAVIWRRRKLARKTA